MPRQAAARMPPTGFASLFRLCPGAQPAGQAQADAVRWILRSRSTGSACLDGLSVAISNETPMPRSRILAFKFVKSLTKRSRRRIKHPAATGVRRQ